MWRDGVMKRADRQFVWSGGGGMNGRYLCVQRQLNMKPALRRTLFALVI